ncbi:MAG: hypothetical protein B9J98_04455 [Candidatus Terraquivivens tikiterensis]|uniref:Uncharacterized protein n=1 Tax=Candidatus Terraquivivens tikiterensis TaxID=1980982 RepID=A0A2R7Y3H8_9ARCH|nr:MAG: hypothetical protein B9J98_04455 [Candidatus Terraquivivens tikiterensis]
MRLSAKQKDTLQEYSRMVSPALRLVEYEPEREAWEKEELIGILCKLKGISVAEKARAGSK